MPVTRLVRATLRRSTVLATPFILVAAFAWFTLLTPETPIEAAHRICDSCGLFEAEVDRMIDNMRHSTLNRDQLFELYRATYADSGEGEACIDCSEAILFYGEVTLTARSTRGKNEAPIGSSGPG